MIIIPESIFKVSSRKERYIKTKLIDSFLHILFLTRGGGSFRTFVVSSYLKYTIKQMDDDY